MNYQSLFRQLYQNFNARQTDAVLAHMHPDVEWPRAFEGGHVTGHDEIRAYWTKQRTTIDAHVEPTEVTERQDGTVEVTVHQIVKDVQGTLLFDGTVKHIYTVQDKLLWRMDIELE